MFYFFLIVSLLTIIWLSSITRRKRIRYSIHEGFTTKTFKTRETVVKNNPSYIYDKFYSTLYDELFDSDMKNEFECMFIHKDFISKYKGKSPVHVLDLGCGTGQHLKILSRYKNRVTGLDQSPHMLKIAKQKLKGYKQVTLKQGDFQNTKILPKKTYTHILCMFYTIYYSKNIKMFFKNCNYWLKPNGYLFIHIINKKKFDPVLEKSSSLIPFFDPQKHSKKRNTQTKLFFDKFNYISDWDLKSKKTTVFSEEFEFSKLPYIRQNKHIFNYYSQYDILKIAEKNGFKLVKLIDEFTIGFNHNFILCLQKQYGD